jgi:hypothetical protein
MGLFNDIMEDVARRLLGEPNPQQSKPQRGILRWGSRGSMEVNTQLGVFYDHEAGCGGGVVDLVVHKGGYTRDGAVEWLRREKFLGGNGGADSFVVDETYDYVDEEGGLLYQVVRLAPKDFRQRRPDVLGGWLWNLQGVRRVLYRLADLPEEIAHGPILIPEGERDVNNLVRLGYGATCNSGGAGEWKASHSESLRGADVVLLPDNDDPGWKHINKVGASLTGVALRIRVLMMPGGAKDVSEWLAKDGTREQLDALIAAAPDWVPPAGDKAGKAKAEAGEQDLLDALARADQFEYAKRRKKAAKELGVRAKALDQEVERRRADKEVAPLYGFWETPPWPETVEGDSLLRDIIQRIHRHVVCSHNAALAAALWIMMSWVHDEVATHSPILNINSAESACGKTTLMGVVSFLMPKCIASVNISRAALYRAIKKWQPSFCIDEFDDELSARNSSEDSKELRAVINSGHTRGQGVLRCVEPSYTPELFPTFCPKAIGMIGRKLPAATLGRCISIELRRRKSSELIEKFHGTDDPGLAELRSRLARWAADSTEALRGVAPPMPEALGDRCADNWRLQLAIADLCGADWGDKARLAALAIEGKSDNRTIGVRLLADISRIFDQDGGDCILSAVLVAKLCEDQEGPWVEFSRGKPLTQAKLARLLGPYGIITETVHPPGVAHGKGYKLVRFEDAFERYLGPKQEAGAG